MNFLDWFSPTRILIILGLALVLVSTVLGYGEVRYHAGAAAQKQIDQLAVDKLKVEAATTLAGETRKVLVLERALADATAKLEADYERRRIDSKAASVALDAAAARNGGRLLDPHASGCGGSGGGAEGAAATGAASGAGDAASPGRLLSEPLSRLLQWVADDAQRINDAYALCRDDAVKVRELVNRSAP